MRKSPYIIYVITKGYLHPAAESQGQYKTSLQEATDTLKTVERCSESELPRKTELMATLYSLIGNAHFEMNDYNKALKYYKMDGDLATDGYVKFRKLLIYFEIAVQQLF